MPEELDRQTPMKVLLATPLGSGATAEYVASSFQFISDCARSRPNIIIDPLIMHGSVIYRSRNVMSNVAIAGGYTHLLFIDSDMGFAPSAIYKLLDSEHDVCGCICPSRLVSPEDIFKASKRAETSSDALTIAASFIGAEALMKEEKDGRAGYRLQSGFVETRRIGMGITLIKVGALLRMRAAMPDLRLTVSDGFYSQIPGVEEVSLFFDPMHRPGSGVLGEDYSFCERWRQCGGKIHALLDEQITHVGNLRVSGTALRKLMLGN